MKLGLIVISLLSLQPILGYVHHMMYKRKQRRTVFSHLHIWYGRILMVIGIINGGRQTGGEGSLGIAFAVLAGIFGGIYIGAAIWGIIKRRRAARTEKTASPRMAESSG